MSKLGPALQVGDRVRVWPSSQINYEKDLTGSHLMSKYAGKVGTIVHIGYLIDGTRTCQLEGISEHFLEAEVYKICNSRSATAFE